MTIKEQLHKLVDELTDEQVKAMLLHFAHRESGQTETIDLGPGTSEDDPFWEIVGLVGDEYDGPTDVSANIHKYVADAIEGEWRR